MHSFGTLERRMCIQHANKAIARMQEAAFLRTYITLGPADTIATCRKGEGQGSYRRSSYRPWGSRCEMGRMPI